MGRMTGAVLALLAILLPALPAWAAGPDPVLKGPVDVAARRALIGKPAGLFACEQPPDPVREVEAVPYLTDRNESIADPDLLAQHRAAVKPVEDYARNIQQIAEAYLRSQPADGSIADCAMDWLLRWAGEDAMLAPVANSTAARQREFMVAAIAVPYLSVREDSTQFTAKREQAGQWFAALGRAIMADWEASPQRPRPSTRIWGGAAVMLAGAAAEDRGLYEAGLRRVRAVLPLIRADGAIQGETDRLSRMRHTHMVALNGLVLAAETAARNGADLYAEQNGAIRRLADLALRGMVDEAVFDGLAGARQQWPGRLSGSMFAWAEAYYARFADARAVPLLKQYRPARSVAFGGDATLAYGSKGLSKKAP